MSDFGRRMVFDPVPPVLCSCGRVRAAGPALAEGCRRVTKSPGKGCQAEKVWETEFANTLALAASRPEA